jgi:hypothetical protein
MRETGDELIPLERVGNDGGGNFGTAHAGMIPRNIEGILMGELNLEFWVLMLKLELRLG